MIQIDDSVRSSKTFFFFRGRAGRTKRRRREGSRRLDVAHGFAAEQRRNGCGMGGGIQDMSLVCVERTERLSE